MRTVLRFGVLLGIMGIVLLTTSCGGGGTSSSSSASPLNLAGTWTVTTVSTKGQPPWGGFSGTTTVTQSGTGLGVDGATTLTTILGSISASQTDTTVNGTFTNSIQKVSYTFIGTLSAGNFTVSASTACNGNNASNAQESTTLSGTVTSSGAHGTYTISRGSACYYSSDTGTFVATKN